MEFLVISESKLKIMLTKSEMKKYGLDSSELDYADKEVRTAFWQILDEAKIKCGFDSKGEKVLIQFYPAHSSAEIFITKLGVLSKSAERSIVGSDRIAMLSSEIRIYRFSSLLSLIEALRRNSDVLSEDSEAYLSENGSFYLIGEERNLRSSSFSEYGEEVPKGLEAYIKERSRLISASRNELIKLARE